MIILIVIFLTLTFNGAILSYFLFRTFNRLLLIGGGMIVGLLVFLLILSCVSYLLKGPFWIIFTFWSYFSLCLYIFFKYLKYRVWRGILNLHLNLANLTTLIILTSYLSLLFLYASGFQVGADADMYWGIATSFTRGNYPTVLPWQPNYLTTYHEGTFIIEGAIRALAPMDIRAIHNFFSAFIISAILIFITGMMREKTRTILSLIPASLGIFLFGGPVILIGNFENFFSNLIGHPSYEYFSGGNGAGVSDIAGLMYSNFYTFGLASFLVFIYLYHLQTKIKYNFRNYLVMIALSILSLSIDETFFLIEILMFFFLLIYQLRNKLVGEIWKLVLLIIVGLCIFLLIQNPIRDSFLTPSPQSRFKLLIESNDSLLQKFSYKRGEHITWNGKDFGLTVNSFYSSTLDYINGKAAEVNSVKWYILDFRLVVLLVLLIATIIGSRLSLLFVAASVLSMVFSFILINTFWPSNHLRFANEASQLLMFSLGILLVDLTLKKRKIFLVISIFLITFLIPQFLVSHAKFLNYAFSREHPYFSSNLISPLFKEIESLVPHPSRIIFFEPYPTDAIAPYMNITAYTKHGLFVPLFSSSPKILNPAYGMEWYDAVNNLSPYALKELDVNYVFVQNAATKRLSSERIQQINNPLFFQPVKIYDLGVLFKIRDQFKNLTDSEVNLKEIITMIGTNKKVYLDKFYLNELRQIFLLKLSKQNHLVGPPHAHGGDFFMYIETEISFEDACKKLPCQSGELRKIEKIEYALMKTEDNPNNLLKGRFEKVISVKYVDLWKNMNLYE